MNKDYELLETFKKDKETWSYLRHKKTGLEIAYHQCETKESGFSFTFRTPVEDQYLGTSHVLEHCVLCGSKKYDVDFWELLSFSLVTSSNAFTDEYSTTYFFNSIEEADVFKVIPILADYVFFPSLTEEAFMQEGFRVEFDVNGDGRKKDIVSVIYNEMRTRDPNSYCVGGIYYKLHELTNEKIKEYHKKYYRADNCLFSYKGTASLDDVLLQLNKFIPELEDKYKSPQMLQKKNLSLKDFLKKVADDEISDDFRIFWSDEEEDFTPAPVPSKKTVTQIIPEYLSKFTPQEYQEKLDKLHKWQARNVRDTAYKIMEPHHINDYEVELHTEESLWKDFEKNKDWIKSRDKNRAEVYTKLEKNSCSLYLRASQLLSREYYAEYSLMFFMQYYFPLKLRKLGRIYTGGFDYYYPADFVLFANATEKPTKTIKFIKECFKEVADYNFTETDVISIRYMIFSFLLSQKPPRYYFTEELFSIKPKELHQAAVKLRDMIYPKNIRTKDEGEYYKLGDVFKDLKTN